MLLQNIKGLMMTAWTRMVTVGWGSVDAFRTYMEIELNRLEGEGGITEDVQILGLGNCDGLPCPSRPPEKDWRPSCWLGDGEDHVAHRWSVSSS